MTPRPLLFPPVVVDLTGTGSVTDPPNEAVYGDREDSYLKNLASNMPIDTEDSDACITVKMVEALETLEDTNAHSL